MSYFHLSQNDGKAFILVCEYGYENAKDLYHSLNHTHINEDDELPRKIHMCLAGCILYNHIKIHHIAETYVKQNPVYHIDDDIDLDVLDLIVNWTVKLKVKRRRDDDDVYKD